MVDPTPKGGAGTNSTLAMNQLESMATATHGNAKALFGILFIQYCSYAFFYIMDHFHDLYPEYFYELKRAGPLNE